MSTVIIVLRDVSFRKSVIDELHNRGMGVRELDALPDIVFVDGITAADFPLNLHPGIASVEDDDPAAFKPAETITLQTDTKGPWPILRHTSRDLPWVVRGLRFPWAGEFSCARDGEGVDFYIVDTGLKPTHQEFEGRAAVLDGWTPVHYHGTACSSCAAGATLGLARGALVWGAAGLRNADNTGSISDILTAINACLSHYNSRAALDRPALLNLSLSGGSNSYNTAVGNCIAAGIVVLAAAANDRKPLSDGGVFPALTQDVICVGGINMADEPYNTGANGTNYGTEVDILGGSQLLRVADITSDEAYRVGSGTSYGTPHVGGVVACMLQGYKRLTSRDQVIQVKKYLYDQATFGRYKNDPRFFPMTSAIAYLDPGPGPHPPIPTLEPAA